MNLRARPDSSGLRRDAGAHSTLIERHGMSRETSQSCKPMPR